MIPLHEFNLIKLQKSRSLSDVSINFNDLLLCVHLVYKSETFQHPNSHPILLKEQIYFRSFCKKNKKKIKQQCRHEKIDVIGEI